MTLNTCREAAAALSRGRKPTVRKLDTNSKPRSGETEILSPLCGLNSTRTAYRGLAPTAKLFRRCAAETGVIEMKLLRYGAPCHERPGILDSNGRIRSLDGIVDDIAGDALSSAGLDKLASLNLEKLPLVEAGTRIGPCVGRVGK